MAIALVKSGAVTADVNAASPAFGQATTAGNLLIAMVNAEVGGGTTGITLGGGSTGWVEVTHTTNFEAVIYYKKNCGASETAPTFTFSGATSGWASLHEFSGCDTSAPLDQSGTSTSGTTCTASGTDGSNNLAVCGFVLDCSKTATVTSWASTWTPSGGTTGDLANSDAVSSSKHVDARYSINSAHSAADSLQNTATLSKGVVNSQFGIIASFKPAASGNHNSATPADTVDISYTSAEQVTLARTNAATDNISAAVGPIRTTHGVAASDSISAAASARVATHPALTEAVQLSAATVRAIAVHPNPTDTVQISASAAAIYTTVSSWTPRILVL